MAAAAAAQPDLAALKHEAIERVDGRVLLSNLHLLFWLSLIPFGTAWMGENRFAAWPVALYGIVLLLAAIAYFILTRALIALHGRESVLATAIGVPMAAAVARFGVPGKSFLRALVVLGHEHCGAIKAAIDVLDQHADARLPLPTADRTDPKR